MRPHAAQFLETARALISQAETMLRVQLFDACGRNAHLAAFHAAQAYIFEREHRVHKTHAGVRAEFSRLTKDEQRFGRDIRGFLARAYNLKSVADYEVGPDAHVSEQAAVSARSDAKLFVPAIAGALDDIPSH